jgi:uncharacterized protein YjbI with pentapeptide repeats
VGRDADEQDAARLLVDLAESDDRERAIRDVKLLTEDALTRTGRGLDLTQADLSGLDLGELDLRRAVLNRTSLYGTRLAGCDLTGASMVCAGIERSDFSGAILRGAYVHALAAQASTFVGADLSGLVDATGALFHGCDLTGARLDRAEFAGTTFYQCKIRGASASGADLHGAMFNECQLDALDLSEAHLDDAVVTRCNLRRTSFRGARGQGLVIQRPSGADELDLSEAHLPALRLSNVRAGSVKAAALRAPGIDVSHCHLPGISLENADLPRGRWDHVCLDGGNLTGAGLAGTAMLQVTARGTIMASVAGEGFTATECDFTKASISGFVGRYATFRNCNMADADLRGAYLYRAVIVGDPPASANMTGADLEGANLTQAYLAADLAGARISGGWATYARLNQSILNGADARGTSMFRASAIKTEFVGTRLGGQRGAILADRCPGLLDALAKSDDPGVAALLEWLSSDFNGAMARDRGKST